MNENISGKLVNYGKFPLFPLFGFKPERNTDIILK